MALTYPFESPSTGCGIARLADYIELSCLKQRDFSFSKQDIIDAIGRFDDNPERIETKVDEAIEELGARSRAVRNTRHYPFTLSHDMLSL